MCGRLTDDNCIGNTRFLPWTMAADCGGQTIFPSFAELRPPLSFTADFESMYVASGTNASGSAELQNDQFRHNVEIQNTGNCGLTYFTSTTSMDNYHLDGHPDFGNHEIIVELAGNGGK